MKHNMKIDTLCAMLDFASAGDRARLLGGITQWSNRQDVMTQCFIPDLPPVYGGDDGIAALLDACEQSDAIGAIRQVIGGIK